MNHSTAGKLQRYASGCLGLADYLRSPGDGRPQPQIPARRLLWSLLLGRWLREPSFHALEQLARSSASRSLGIYQSFGDDALSYFTERLDPKRTRQALGEVLHRAKRNKAFHNTRHIGLALDGTAAGRSRMQTCHLCRPHHRANQATIAYCHHVVVISVVGTGLTLPFDAEPYGPGDSEYAAGQRLLARAVGELGTRFADYVVVDSGFATAPFLHAAGHAGLHVVARLKSNLPELASQVEQRFGGQAPTHTYQENKQRIEIWDADDFDPWESLQWPTVRVIHYRQHHPDGSLVEATWLTNFSSRQVGSLTLFHMAKSRWEIENQGFNDAKNRYGFEHINHHHANSVLISWLLTLLAIVIERLFRLRYLHRGPHSPCSAEQLCRLLWLGISRPVACNTS